MNSKDDPFGPAGKTVIRATPRRERKPAPVPQEPVADGGQPSPIKESTVFDPGVGRHTPPGWTSGTVLYQGTPSAAAPALSQETLLDVTDSVRYSAANPILAAAAPLLMLFGQLRLIPVERQAEPLADHVTEALGHEIVRIAERRLDDFSYRGGFVGKQQAQIARNRLHLGST